MYLLSLTRLFPSRLFMKSEIRYVRGETRFNPLMRMRKTWGSESGEGLLSSHQLSPFTWDWGSAQDTKFAVVKIGESQEVGHSI